MRLGDVVTLDALAQAPYSLAARLREQEPVAYAPALDRWLVTPHALVVQVPRAALPTKTIPAIRGRR